MRNISTTTQEQYTTEAGNVRVSRIKRGLWEVHERGADPIRVRSQQHAFQEARAIEARRARTVDAAEFMERYIEAAQRHGEVSEPDHEVGDLQDMCRALWEILTPEQRAAVAGDARWEHES